jgi:hypothetical protein
VKSQAHRAVRFEMEALEPRFLLSADPAVVPVPPVQTILLPVLEVSVMPVSGQAAEAAEQGQGDVFGSEQQMAELFDTAETAPLAPADTPSSAFLQTAPANSVDPAAPEPAADRPGTVNETVSRDTSQDPTGPAEAENADDLMACPVSTGTRS